MPFPESSLNDEAGKLFMDSYDEFARRAKIMTEVHAKTIGSDNANGKCSGSSLGSSSSPGKQRSTTKKDKSKEAKKKSLKRL